MKYKTVYILLLISLVRSLEAYGQGKVTRPAKNQSQTSTSKNLKPQVKISEPDGFINGHGYVDLGLPSGIMWATCNVGSEQPWENGDYFSWGETIVKDDYSNEYYAGPSNDPNRYADIDGTKYDAAYTLWGEDWEIPTKDLYEELINECIFKWVIINKKDGWKVIGKNGHSIFLPAAGYKPDAIRMCNNIETGYWTASPSDSNFIWEMTGVKGRDNIPKIMRTRPQVGISIRPISRNDPYKDIIRQKKSILQNIENAASDSIRDSAPKFGF